MSDEDIELPREPASMADDVEVEPESDAPPVAELDP
ncbi:MAG: hypothetical protein QOK19_2053, partial [Solirubrobacteraceae bacterium]|nr:hypothetical protein [Solirubrobacteraceae bacterium]